MSADASPEASIPQENAETPASASTEPPSGRRRPSVAAAKKGIRTLTTAQLEKKRANDREAQRAIRERTKTQIETLEKRIQDLESGEAYRQLQAALKEKKAIEQENVDIKNRLASVLKLLEPLFPAGQLQSNGVLKSLTGASDAVLDVKQSPAALQLLTGRSSKDSIEIPLKEESAPYPPIREARDRGSDSAATPPSAGPFHRAAPVSDATWDRARQDYAYYYGFGPPGSEGRSSTVPSGSDDAHAGSDSASSLKRKRSTFDPVLVQPSNADGSAAPRSDPQTAPAYTQLPTNIGPTCQFDTILSDFATAARRSFAAGVPFSEIVGPPYPTLNRMLEPESDITADHHLSNLTIEMMKGFSAITGLPEKVACMINMFYYMQWVISPTREHFDYIPLYFRPVEAQLKIPHPIWVDYLPFPKMREKMVYRYPWLPLDNFFMPYTTGLSINYPGSQDAPYCIYRDPDTGELHPRPEFLAHVGKLESWSVGQNFARAHPELAETAFISEYSSSGPPEASQNAAGTE